MLWTRDGKFVCKSSKVPATGSLDEVQWTFFVAAAAYKLFSEACSDEQKYFDIEQTNGHQSGRLPRVSGEGSLVIIE
jgi:hypothetical protein